MRVFYLSHWFEVSKDLPVHVGDVQKLINNPKLFVAYVNAVATAVYDPNNNSTTQDTTSPS